MCTNPRLITVEDWTQQNYRLSRKVEPTYEQGMSISAGKTRIFHGRKKLHGKLRCYMKPMPRRNASQIGHTSPRQRLSNACSL